jgi:hypothetical protein
MLARRREEWLSSPWRNRIFLSGAVCIRNSDDFDGGRMVMMKKKSLCGAWALKCCGTTKETEK